MCSIYSDYFVYSHATAPSRIVADESAHSLSLADVFAHSYRLAKGRLEIVCAAREFMVCICEWLDLIVETSKSDPMWVEHGHLALLATAREKGVVKRHQSPALKRSLSVEFYNRKGNGLQTMSQMVQGMSVSLKTAPSLKRRKGAAGSACSQDPVAMPQTTASDITGFELYNTFLEIQSLGPKIKHCLHVCGMGAGGWGVALVAGLRFMY